MINATIVALAGIPNTKNVCPICVVSLPKKPTGFVKSFLTLDISRRIIYTSSMEEKILDSNVINEVVKLFKKSTKITVFTGAGISVSCGVPDFRNGLYSTVGDKYNLPYPEAIFDIEYFRSNPAPFFDLSKDLMSSKIEPSLAHKFIARLEDMGKIAVVITQNIDGLHNKAGNKKVVECHGTYSTAHCLKCKRKYSLVEIRESLENGKVAYCSLCGGVVKPDITFFGERLPKEFYDLYDNCPDTDLLFVVGSSLTVQPAAGFALALAARVPSILLNLSKTEYDNCFTWVVNDKADKICKIISDNLDG